MHRTTRTYPLARPILALAASLTLALGLAQGTPRIEAGAVPFADAVGLVGVDLGWDDGLVLVLAPSGVGGLGDAVVPAYDASTLPRDALGRILVDEALTRTGIVTAHAGGLAFVHTGGTVDGLTASYARRLGELDFEVTHVAGDRQFTFVRHGMTYRATFGAAEGGVQVYLGR